MDTTIKGDCKFILLLLYVEYGNYGKNDPGLFGFYNHKSSWCCTFGFATVSGYDQLVVGPTHARGGTLDLLMIDVPDLERV